MCANPLGDVPRLVSVKPNDYLQITFHNEDAKRTMHKNEQYRRRNFNQNPRSDFSSGGENSMGRNFNSRNNNSCFNRPVDTWQNPSQSTHRGVDRSISSHSSNNPPTYSNVTGEFGVRHLPAHRHPRQPVGYRSRPDQPNGHSHQHRHNQHQHMDVANGFRSHPSSGGQNQARPPRRLPLSHPSRFLDDPYRDYKPPVDSPVDAPVRAPKRVPVATTPPDIHQPPPSVTFKQRQLQRAGSGSTAPGTARGRSNRHQPWEQPAPQQQSQPQRYWRNDRSGGGGGQENGFQRYHQMATNTRHQQDRQQWRAEPIPPRGRFSTSSRQVRGPRMRHQNNYQNTFEDTHQGKDGSLRGRRKGPPSPAPPFLDEYIDDFTPEDLVKYNLQIDMENFTVQSPLISDPILNVPLSTTWLTDDLYQTVTATSPVHSKQFSWPVGDTHDWGCPRELLHLINGVDGHQEGIARSRSLGHMVHRDPVALDRANSCPGCLDVGPGDDHASLPDAFKSTASLPDILSPQRAVDRSTLFHSRSHPEHLHVVCFHPSPISQNS